MKTVYTFGPDQSLADYRFDARRDAQADSAQELVEEAKKLRERITTQRQQALCEDVAFVGDVIGDFLGEAKRSLRPERMVKAQEISGLIMSGGSGEDVCDYLRSVVEAKAMEKAQDEYDHKFGCGP